ncbi:hypothetical protein JCM11251_001923 [Rhodosporidiobolus azoricus]
MSRLSWTPEDEKAAYPLLAEPSSPVLSSRRRRLPTRLLERATLLVLVGAVVYLSRERREALSSPSRKQRTDERCDAYALPGVLRISLDPSERHLNAWEPSLSTCRPVDYLSMMLERGPRRKELDFLRNRTVVLFGDSVDRGFTEHLCRWANEREELIDEEHPLSPPLPAGREYPPEGYRSLHSRFPPGQPDRFWPGVPFGRPHICHIRKYNFRVVQVFQFGVDEEDEWLTQQNHFVPPGGFEERFDQILLPLLDNIAQERSEKEGSPASPIPDLVSFTSTFWTPFRHVRLLGHSTNAADWERELGTWAPPTREWQNWFERRWTKAVRHIGRAWSGEEKPPKLVFRELQQILARDDIPSNHVQLAIDVGRRVVDLLREESAAARSSESWAAWQGEEAELGATWVGQERDEVGTSRLDERLEVLEWGKRFMAQQAKFTDNGPAGVHPHPLPGSYLFWNMLLDRLHRSVHANADEEM